MHDGGEDRIFISTVPANRRERRLALGVVLLSLAIFLALIPFAQVPLTPLWAFIPSYESALIICDLVTAALLFAQYEMQRSRALLVLSCAYLFTATMTVPHALSFPGLFTPTGLLGSGPQTTAWLYMFWHAGFPLLVVAYALLKTPDRDQAPSTTSSLPAIAAGVGAVLIVAVLLTVLTTSGHDLLPQLIVDKRYTPAMMVVNSTVWVLSLIALGVLWMRRPHLLLDTWLMVVISAWLFDVGLSTVFNGTRFDLGFYAGRIYGLTAATFVLLVLLRDTAGLYAQLVHLFGAEQQKRIRAAERHRRLFDTSSDLLLVTDRRGQFLEVSPSSKAILDYAPEEMIGRTGAAFLYPDDIESTRNEMRLARRGRSMRNFDARYVHKNGKIITLAWSGTWSEIEQVHFFIGRDVTEARHVERLKNEFVATVSHELRTPLTAIVGSLGLLTTAPEPLPNLPRLIEIAHKNSQRLLWLFNDILDIETIEGDRMVLDIKPASLTSAVEDAIEAARGLAEALSVKVRLEAASDAIIGTDEKRLTQVVSNLVANAVKFSPRGGEVIVTTDVSYEAVGVTVRDYGPGIPEDYKARVYEKFVQVDASDTRQKGGAGLGLSIAKQLMIRLGGEISHEPAPGGGTVFRIVLARPSETADTAVA